MQIWLMGRLCVKRSVALCRKCSVSRYLPEPCDFLFKLDEINLRLDGFLNHEFEEVKMKMVFDLNSKNGLDNFMEVVNVLDEYLKSLPLKEDKDLRIKIEVECRFGTILKFERWLTDLLEEK